MDVVHPPGPPGGTPIGIVVAQTAKAMDRAFDDALGAAGGTRATWLVLLAVKSGQARTQGAIADRVGIRSPTLTHHLDRMERDLLVTRERHSDNRRVQRVELTDRGHALFSELRKAAVGFDQRARAGITDDEIETARGVLDRLRENVGAPAGSGSG
jgi:MarR family transcriptional regulator, transcriptional regulator for hemolysin